MTLFVVMMTLASAAPPSKETKPVIKDWIYERHIKIDRGGNIRWYDCAIQEEGLGVHLRCLPHQR